MRTIIYGLNDCTYCIELKKALNTLGIKYVYIDLSLDDNKKYLDELIEITGSDNIPVVKCDNSLFAPNHSYNTVEELIELIKYSY
jgi:glutaredoxin